MWSNILAMFSLRMMLWLGIFVLIDWASFWTSVIFSCIFKPLTKAAYSWEMM